MIIIFTKGFKDINSFVNYFKSLGLEVYKSLVDDQYIIKVSGPTYLIDDHYLNAFEHVQKLVRLDSPCDLVK